MLPTPLPTDEDFLIAAMIATLIFATGVFFFTLIMIEVFQDPDRHE